MFEVLGTENSAGKFPTGESACLTGYAESTLKLNLLSPLYNSTLGQLYEAQ